MQVSNCASVKLLIVDFRSFLPSLFSSRRFSQDNFLVLVVFTFPLSSLIIVLVFIFIFAFCVVVIIIQTAFLSFLLHLFKVSKLYKINSCFGILFIDTLGQSGFGMCGGQPNQGF